MILSTSHSMYIFLFIFSLIFKFSLQIFAQETTFNAHTISESLSKPTAVFVEDVNNDGHQDFIITSAGENGEVSWFENDGRQNFKKHVITSRFASARSVVAIDLDQNGTTDIIAASRGENRVTWWRNNSNENFEEIDIDSNFLGAHTIDVNDINNDGFFDVLCSGTDLDGNNTEVAWWENDGDQKFTKHVISSRFQKATFITAADINRDSYMDIVVCGELAGDIVWYKNDGTHSFSTENVIDKNYPRAHTAFAQDLDNDGDLEKYLKQTFSGTEMS